MISKLILALLLIVLVFTQQASNSPSQNQFDVDQNQANSLINSLFAGNPNAARSIQASSTPAPTSAPQGATLSASAPTAAQRSQVAATSSFGLGYPGFPGGGYPGGGSIGGWGRWVRVLRCNYQPFGSGFCCRWVWIWRYW